jgi:hypothetical protein
MREFYPTSPETLFGLSDGSVHPYPPEIDLSALRDTAADVNRPTPTYEPPLVAPPDRAPLPSCEAAPEIPERQTAAIRDRPAVEPEQSGEENPPKVYASLFEKHDDVWDDLGPSRYIPLREPHARTRHALFKLEGNLRKEWDDEPSSTIRRIVEPVRILTSIIDYQIDRPEGAALTPLIVEAKELALAVYRQDPDALERLKQLEKTIRKTEPDIIDAPAKHDVSDNITWESMNPKYSAATTQKIIKETQGESILLIPLARGGVAPGLDVFLRYTDLTGDNQSAVYPIRFSRHKAVDHSPRVTGDEADYLRQMAQTRFVVVFDEDSYKSRDVGNTLDRAREYFTHFFGRPIMATANRFMQ